MIIKSYELQKTNLKNRGYFLFYGNNRGLIKEVLEKNINILVSKNNIYKYDESEIINNLEIFNENISNKSFFENEKLIIISRVTDKIFNIFEDLVEKKLDDTIIVLISDNLEKKSKLRKLFEKEKTTICVPFYEDNQQSLGMLANTFLRQKNIPISQENINLIIERSRGDRINLYNELEKIELLSKSRKKIETKDILELTNLSENYDISQLIDNALAKNHKRTVFILNENNFAEDESIMIIRIFLNKLKRLLKLQSQIKNENDLEKVITSFKPPIFWKEKDIIKKQLKILSYNKIKNLIVNANKIELLIKKNPVQSINILYDFILNQSVPISN